MRLLSTLFLIIMTMSTVQATESTPLHYLVREPKSPSAQTPVIILLHGVGSNEQDLFSFANRLPENYLVISARAPIRLATNSYAWYRVDFSTGKPTYDFKETEKSLQTLIAFTEEIKRKYALSNKQLVLCGFSQGAIMSYSVALTRPDLVSGIAAMSGRLLEEIKPQVVKTSELQKLRILITHGKNDQVISIDHSRKATAYLNTLKIEPMYFEYEASHEINEAMLGDLVKWLK